jgi:hypothetical protein
MFVIATASADTYITNKIVDGSRVEDANVGRAGTLDLFKLYNETLSGSAGFHTELSRILIKFDTSRINELSSGTLDVNASSFRAKLRLKPVQTNLPVPRDFTVSIFPLAKKFDEGDGRDVSGFTDIDAANYVSSSANVLWTISGAYASGAIGDSGIDYYSSGNLQDGLGLRSLEFTQTFIDGTEDLFVDVSDIVSATIGGVIPDYGFLIAFTSSQETDTTSRFVKRFASRHVTQESLRPRLEISCNNAIFDAHAGSYFDVSGSLYLRNFAGSSSKNLLSSSIEITGSNCLHVILSTGSYSKTLSASQESIGSFFKSGSYSAGFYISAQDSSVVSGTITLSDHVAASGSITFSEKWKSIDGSVTFLSTFLTCSLPTRSAFSSVSSRLNVRSTNVSSKYSKFSSGKIRVFAYDSSYDPSASRISKPTRSSLPEMYFRIKDLEGEVYVPFERANGGTRLSTDSDGLFFDIFTDGLPEGKTLTIDYLVVDRGAEYIIEDKNARFSVGD